MLDHDKQARMLARVDIMDNLCGSCSLWIATMIWSVYQSYPCTCGDDELHQSNIIRGYPLGMQIGFNEKISIFILWA